MENEVAIQHHDLFSAIMIILAQTFGLAVGYFLTEWVKGDDPDEDLDNEER